MTLADFVAELAGERRTVTVYGLDPRPGFAAWLADWNVELRFQRLPPEADRPFLTVRRGDRFLGAVDAAAVAEFLDPTAIDPGVDPPADVGTFLALLDETVFSSVRPRSLLAASREFEDRALRVGSGRLHAGFQRPETFATRRAVYERLAERGIDVHVYVGEPWSDAGPPTLSLHTAPGSELTDYWIVAYDGDGEAEQACALLAEERAPRSYLGFWTYDRKRARAICAYLRERYW